MEEDGRRWLARIYKRKGKGIGNLPKKIHLHASFFSEKDHPQGDIEDATKPTVEVTATTLDLKGKSEEELSPLLPELTEEDEIREWKEEESGEGALKNVRVEASIGETVNLGNMEFYKINAAISGDVGRKGRKAAWKEAWEEVEAQKAAKLIGFLKARVMK